MPSRSVSGDHDSTSPFRAGAIALIAGGVGLIAGALAVTMTSADRSAEVAAKPPVETTGSAPSVRIKDEEPGKTPDADTSARSEMSSECDRQTWPYITQQCLVEREAAQRKVRVITTDRIAPPVVTAIEAERDVQRVREKPAKAVEPPRETVAVAPAEPKPEPAAEAATKPATAVSPQQPAQQGIPAAVVFNPTPATPAAAMTATSESPKPAAAEQKPAEAPQAAPTVEPAPKRAASQDKPHKAATNGTRTRSARDTRGPDTRGPDIRGQEARRRGPAQDANAEHLPRVTSTRVVERWTEREYEVPTETGGRRRVIVRTNDARPTVEYRQATEYRPSGGLFEALFGGAFR
jgi:hypothetical protein